MNERSRNVCMRAPLAASSHLEEEPTPTASFSPLTIDRGNALGHSYPGPDGMSQAELGGGDMRRMGWGMWKESMTVLRQ
jgi:hypothetical protein